jgi:orotidine-5'-phosphate decarboxylase
MTVNAYQGVGSLAGPISLARESGKGLLVLAATSNPESLPSQTAVIAGNDSIGARAGKTVAAGIVDEVIGLNAFVADSAAGSAIGSFGVVIGATVDPARFGIRLEELAKAPATPVLAPGFGHQGVGFSALRGQYGAAAPFVIASTSRDVLAAGPGGIAEAVARHAGELAECLA